MNYESLKALILVLIIIAIGWGWLANLYLFVVECDFEPDYKCEAVRGVGIFVAPVGVIAGYVDIGE
jgi:hypothetical protein